MCGGLLAQILILLQTPFVHLVKQIHDRKQLIRIGAFTLSYLWALSVNIRDSLIKQIVTRGRQLTKVILWASSLGTVDPVLHCRPGMKAQFQSFLSQIVETLHRISRTSLLFCQHSVSCDVGTPGNITQPG